MFQVDGVLTAVDALRSGSGFGLRLGFVLRWIHDSTRPSFDSNGGTLMARRLTAPAVVLLAAAMAVGSGSSSVGAQNSPVVTAAVQVTADPAPIRGHSTPQIAVNPTNGELVVVESDPRSATRSCNIHMSVDDGRSWSPGGDPMQKPFTDCSFYAEYGAYANLAFAGNGTLYVAFVASEPLGRIRDETPRSVFLARSTDGGRSFTTETVFKAPDGNPDVGLNKGPVLAVDPKNPERVYVGWRQGVFTNAKMKLRTNVAATTDGGRTFGPPVDLSSDRGGDYPALGVGGDGTLHAALWSRNYPPVPFTDPQPVQPAYYRQSTDGGKTFSSAQEIFPGNARGPRPPRLAVDPRSNAVYVVWYTHAEAENLRPGFAEDLEIFFRSSLDGGRTWEELKVLNDDSKQGVKVNQFDPGIAIAPDGRVDVAWYDGRLNPRPPVLNANPSERGLQDVFYTSSTDEGRTFSPNVRVNDRSFDRSIGVWSNNIDSHFNVGVSSTRDAVYFAWQDSRNGSPETNAEDVYVASLKRTGSAVVSESSDSPDWGFLVSGVALGLGLAMVTAWLVARRQREPT